MQPVIIHISPNCTSYDRLYDQIKPVSAPWRGGDGEKTNQKKSVTMVTENSAYHWVQVQQNQNPDHHFLVFIPSFILFVWWHTESLICTMIMKMVMKVEAAVLTENAGFWEDCRRVQNTELAEVLRKAGHVTVRIRLTPSAAGRPAHSGSSCSGSTAGCWSSGGSSGPSPAHLEPQTGPSSAENHPGSGGVAAARPPSWLEDNHTRFPSVQRGG